MPAYNAAAFLPRSLPAAILAARGARVLVVDPGSTDDTAKIAKSLGVEVHSLGHRAGPALARNRGVERCDTDVVLFVDSDCVCHPDVGERVTRAFAADPNLVSLTGSYDTKPPEQNFFSLYMNLRHHFVHQRARREGATFWAGCGAVRTDAFRRVGGFDAAKYPMPMIEDLELGLRLRREGLTRLDPDLQVTHLKRWTLRSVIDTDIRCRAVPWGKIILESGELPNDLNLAWPQRVAAALAPVVLLSVVSIPAALLTGQFALGAALTVPAVVSLGINGAMVRFFAELRGVHVAAGVFLFHQVHLTYSAVTMAVLAAGHVVSSGRR